MRDGRFCRRSLRMLQRGGASWEMARDCRDPASRSRRSTRASRYQACADAEGAPRRMQALYEADDGVCSRTACWRRLPYLHIVCAADAGSADDRCAGSSCLQAGGFAAAGARLDACGPACLITGGRRRLGSEVTLNLVSGTGCGHLFADVASRARSRGGGPE